MRNFVAFPLFGKRGICIHSSQDRFSTCTQGLLYSVAFFSYSLISPFVNRVWLAQMCPAGGGTRSSHRAHWPWCNFLDGSGPSGILVSVGFSSPAKVRNLRFLAHRVALVLDIWCWRILLILEENSKPSELALLPLVSSFIATLEKDGLNGNCIGLSVRHVKCRSGTSC